MFADVRIVVGSLRCLCVSNGTHGNELDIYCLGTFNGSQYTSSPVEARISSFGAVLRHSKPHCNTYVQFESTSCAL